jgi:TetR/AcrR family transcriptional regulator, mexJK operon transcriptional repressor
MSLSEPKAVAKSAARVRRSKATVRPKPAPAPGKKRIDDPRRDRLVRLAAPLFLKNGYDNVSIDDIIAVAGGSKATLYSWFGGKEGLFEAVVRQKCDDVTLAIHFEAHAPIEKQLTQIATSFVTMVLSPPILEFHRLMVSIGRTFPEAGRLFFQTGPVAAYDIVAEWISVQQKDGALIREDPYKLAVLFLDMLVGEHQLGWLTAMPRAARKGAIDETVRLSVRVFLNGAAAR